jgi:hypothetical protein
MAGCDFACARKSHEITRVALRRGAQVIFRNLEKISGVTAWGCELLFNAQDIIKIATALDRSIKNVLPRDHICKRLLGKTDFDRTDRDPYTEFQHFLDTVPVKK